MSDEEKTTPPKADDELKRELESASGRRRFDDEQVFAYIQGMLLSDQLNIPAQSCAIHTEAVDLIAKLGGQVPETGPPAR